MDLSGKQMEEIVLGDKLKERHMQVGMLYIARRNLFVDKAFVCLGKRLGTNELYFAVVGLNACLSMAQYKRTVEGYSELEIDLRESMKKGFAIVGIHLLSISRCLADLLPVYELFKDIQVKEWLMQMKLTGRPVKLIDDVYLGDWRKREKLSCVREFMYNRLYLKEEVAYVRQNVEVLGMHDKVWCYRGKEEDKYIWQEFPVKYAWEYYLHRDYRDRGFSEYKHRSFTEHLVVHQYKDMVEIGNTWRFEHSGSLMDW